MLTLRRLLRTGFNATVAGGAPGVAMGKDRNERFYSSSRYVAFQFYELDCPAFRALSADARALLIEFRKRFNGTNNGAISFSMRDMMAALNTTGKDRTIHAQRELQAKGFVKITRLASFDTRKQRFATEFILTNEAVPGPGKNSESASKEFMRWKSEADNFPIMTAPPKNTGPAAGAVGTGRRTQKYNMGPAAGAIGTVNRCQSVQIDESDGTGNGSTYNIPDAAVRAAPATVPDASSVCLPALSISPLLLEDCGQVDSEVTPDDGDELLSIEEAAKKSEVSWRTVYRWIDAGLPIVKEGRSRRVRLSELKAWNRGSRGSEVQHSAIAENRPTP